MTRPEAGTGLVVDDGPINRMVARACLERLGYAVSEAAEGAAGLAACAAAMPDLILLDRLMPGMDGDAFLRALRALPGGGEPRVLFCSGDAEPPPAGLADGQLTKPFSIQALIAAIERVAAARRLDRAA